MPSTAAGSRRTTHTSRATAANARSQPSSTTAPPSSSSSSSSSALAIAPRTKNKAKNKDCADHDAPDGSVPKKPRPPRPAPKVLPRRYDKADPRDLVVLIASMLMELIGFNDDIPLRDGRLTRFHSRSPPRISVRDYLARLTTHATLSPPILLSMVYYIDLLCELYPSFTVSSLTVHRFLITAATVASKGLSDSFWTNKTYSRVGGISVPELALLELEFLWRVEWRIVPQPEKLVEYYQNLVERCADYVMEPEPALTDPEPDPRPYQHARPHGGSVG
ncbi:Pho80p cyclin [Ophidiomyces ophidiicola]|nr:Pho80p cyclin [Ophidiomyces ophidiicola]KAI1977454.1 Pho80p cyclin [Ophidiomyces ophidiicola]KAI1988009.1 Pho80p cyclin [Ophidiomyces ophidiicola]KAI1989814.1 Pho80p cyclin [Ophidiomyces ophidiicola]KAI2020171.1 Pho80p cyclin [Ophidiomyces ophidiicola]